MVPMHLAPRVHAGLLPPRTLGGMITPRALLRL
jgi:hypothetical protein